jgi:mono/diheme cytochrome c family protein
MISYRLLVLVLVIGSFMLTVSCSARRGEPIKGPFPIEALAVGNGQKIFMRECHQCHPGGEAGLGPAINNKPLPGFMIRLQVRNGIGAMPAFSQSEINPEEMDDLLEFLKALRRHS